MRASYRVRSAGRVEELPLDVVALALPWRTAFFQGMLLPLSHLPRSHVSYPWAVFRPGSILRDFPSHSVLNLRIPLTDTDTNVHYSKRQQHLGMAWNRVRD